MFYANDLRKIALRKLKLCSVKMKMFIEIPILNNTITQLNSNVDL